MVNDMKSPLLFPVALKEGVIYVLDETQIPFNEEYIEVKDLGSALSVLGQMKTRSLGQVLLYFYSCILFSDSSSPEQIAKQFKETRPTFDFPMLAHIINGQIQKGLKVKDAVDNFVLGFDAMRKKRAQNLAAMLPDSAHILTICNVNGELIYLYDELKELGKTVLFYVCETRPYLQGTRLTFWELRKNNIPTKLICDNQVASIMSEGLVNCVVTGADRATVKGDVINKVGTYAIARLANCFDIPFYPLTQYPRDIDIDTIEIEERPEKEALMHLDDNLIIDSFYPAFDIIKADWVTEAMALGS